MARSAPTTSPLDHPPGRFAERSFFEETVALLRGVRDHDLDSLATLCDDDFGIIDIDPAGQPPVLRTRPEWEG